MTAKVGVVERAGTSDGQSRYKMTKRGEEAAQARAVVRVLRKNGAPKDAAF